MPTVRSARRRRVVTRQLTSDASVLFASEPMDDDDWPRRPSMLRWPDQGIR
ncbi:hypothetical protein [Mycobacterium sp.]|uniref:hypothetical protein n=1 Tax=Mycobacterium sp. TaxID=1785 RepID=UPI00333E70D2